MSHDPADFTLASETATAPEQGKVGVVGSGALFGPLRDRIIRQRRISYADYQDLRSAHALMDDPAGSVVWRMIKTYEKFNHSVMPLHAGEIEAIAESWPNSESATPRSISDRATDTP